ncbi:unnamed protein product [Rotaria socialis]|uniref:Uncharacterized protein n=3 Tax=Rotaria socialis TaxID=392032 RepID=A0A817KHH7_9BILA|nr:unnamed protein product [Rotaria socialis]CAF3784805.1 unnamed protein product [Rotaria socialis]
MDLWWNSLLDIIPLPILIGMFIWTFSMCFFSLFLFFIFILLHKRSSSLAELVSVKELSKMETNRKSGFSCDSLSLMSGETTRNDIEDTISSFYLKNSNYLKENKKMSSLPSIKLCPIINENRQINTLPQLSTRRSIIRDLTSVSNSFNDKKIHQSIDSLFSKDSLIE